MMPNLSPDARHVVAALRHLRRVNRRRWILLGVGALAITGAARMPAGPDIALEEVVLSEPSRALQGPVLADGSHARVDFWVDRFSTRQREVFQRILQNRGRYEHMIRAKLEARGLPQDLIYLALIESGFEEDAVSWAGAVGLWQFMPATARAYGLRVDAVVDERMDPVKSTDAALDYLTDLHWRFDSWYLAAAAYNGGPTRVSRILKSFADGRYGDEAIYWEVLDHLPVETAHYVPRLLAARAVAREPGRFGIDATPVARYEYEVVWVAEPTELTDVAAASGVPVEELQALNPHLIAGRTPRVLEPWPLRVPTGTSMQVAETFWRPAAMPVRMALVD